MEAAGPDRAGAGAPGPRQGLADQEFFDAGRRRGRRAGRPVPGALHRDAEAAAGADLRQRLRRAAPPAATRSSEAYLAYLAVVRRAGRWSTMAAITTTLAKALNTGLRAAMEDDPKVIVMGEDVGKLGGVFRVTDGLQKDFGEHRVLDTPLAESGIIGTAVGLAMRGLPAGARDPVRRLRLPRLRPDHLAGRQDAPTGRRGLVPMPMVIRIPFGGGIGAVEHHASRRSRSSRTSPGCRWWPARTRGRLRHDPAGHRLRRPGGLLRAQAAVLGEGRRRSRRATPPPLFSSRVLRAGDRRRRWSATARSCRRAWTPRPRRRPTGTTWR